MSDIWVANASPLIALATVGCLDLLERSCREVLIPFPVVEEVLAGPSTDRARQAIEAGWGHRVECSPAPLAIVEWGLGEGETAVLALAVERKLTAVLDDAAARTCAKAIGIRLIGTLGVVLRAKNKGIIPSAADVLRAVRDAGLYLDNDLIRAALKGVGEVWE